MKAVIKIGGKQVLVSENDVIYVEKIDAEVGQTVKFNEVLMLDSKVGNPYVSKASVEGVIVKQGKNTPFLGCTNYTADGKGCNRMMTYKEFRILTR